MPWLSDRAPVLIAGQAPGAQVHAKGRPFDDRSGDRLRDWLGVDRAAFYDRDRFAVLPMAFCFPGYDARGADLPPPPVCAATWRARALAAMPQRAPDAADRRPRPAVAARARRGHRDRARAGATSAPTLLPLPHPSWRNTGWLRRNPWFETELVPELRRRVAALIGRA